MPCLRSPGVSDGGCWRLQPHATGPSLARPSPGLSHGHHGVSVEPLAAKDLKGPSRKPATGWRPADSLLEAAVCVPLRPACRDSCGLRLCAAAWYSSSTSPLPTQNRARPGDGTAPSSLRCPLRYPCKCQVKPRTSHMFNPTHQGRSVLARHVCGGHASCHALGGGTCQHVRGGLAPCRVLGWWHVPARGPGYRDTGERAEGASGVRTQIQPADTWRLCLGPAGRRPPQASLATRSSPKQPHRQHAAVPTAAAFITKLVFSPAVLDALWAAITSACCTWCDAVTPLEYVTT